MRRVSRANRRISLTCSWNTARPCLSGRVDIRFVFAFATRTRSNVQDVCARECARCATVQVRSCARSDLTKLDSILGTLCSKSSRTFTGHIEQLEADLKQSSALVNALERASIVSPTEPVSDMSESVVVVESSNSTTSRLDSNAVAAESRIDEAEYDIV
jgi:hypothetical protein